MELDGANLKSPVDKSRSIPDIGHDNSHSVYEQSPNNPSTTSEGTGTFSPKSSHFQADEDNDATARRNGLLRLLKGKEREWAAVVEKKNGPLRLLDLPMDVLKEIVKEVTHTNDLTSLALTHSALHNLVIPLIYSRFDIVWPDANNTAEARAGVDALTYGLATLVMSEDVFGDARCGKSVNGSYCENCTCDKCQNVCLSNATALRPVKKCRRGNYFAQFTRKFSLGNGPPDWVSEYLINKEGGKMLGTLVALSVARMPNLETFIWDMPTGILRDVWISLASLDDRENGRRSRLEKLWIRFHDNQNPELGSTQTTAVIQPAQSQLGVTPNVSNVQPNSNLSETPALTILELSYRCTENPSFSILPPLKNLSVLDVDEPAYLDEISVLVAKSIDTLRELRIGIASTAPLSGWASLASVVGHPWSPEFPNGETSATGGVFGMIMSKIYDRSGRNRCSRALLQNAELLTKSPIVEVNEIQPTTSVDSTGSILNSGQIPSENHKLIPVNTAESESGALIDTPLPTGESELVEPLQPLSLHALASGPRIQDEKKSHQGKSQSEKYDDGHSNATSVLQSEALEPKKLRLEVLEIERIVIDVKVLQESINWSILSTLTLLQCHLHEQLWKTLRRVYTPRSSPFAISQSCPTSKRLSSQPSLRSLSQRLHHPSRSGIQSSVSGFQSITSSAYRLNLKRIHTDAVSPALISFLKETLAPNSLEWMFLQDGREYVSPVSINAIFRGPIRYHRGSLTKIMIDSAIGKPDNTRNLKRKKWIFPRKLLAFITSGKMSRLKELAMAVDYKDWHFFVQRLPQIPHLRSLYVPYIADHVYGHHLDAKELALQLVDVVAIRPEIEICYLGFSTTCFELLENRHHEDSSWSRFDTSTAPAHASPGGVDVTDDDSDNDDDNEEDDDDVNNSDPAADPASEDPEDSDSDAADGSIEESDEDSLESEKQRPILKLREILFYDDKVSIFKARHGRL